MRIYGERKNLTSSLKYGKTAELTAEIVSAYLMNHFVPAGQLVSLISIVVETLSDVGRLSTSVEKPVAPGPNPAVAVEESVTEDFIVCLEDGKKFKTLKRHLAVKYNMTPREYRAKWALGNDYPMVAPAYAKVRSKLAKGMGLGRKQ